MKPPFDMNDSFEDILSDFIEKSSGCIIAATTPSGVVGVAEWIGGDDRFRRR